MQNPDNKQETSEPRRAIWSEFVRPELLCRADVLRPLAQRGVRLLWAVGPGMRGQLDPVGAALEQAGVSWGLWPLLSDRRGRWLSGKTAPHFAARLEQLWRSVDRAGLSPREVFLDLEPEIAAMSAGVGRMVRRAVTVRRGQAASLSAMTHDIRQRGARPSAAVLPPLLWDGQRAGHPWQRFLDTPLSGQGFGRVSAMLYSSMIQGYSRRTLRRPDVRRILFDASRLCASRFGDRASVSVGITGPGALGNERAYDSVDQLRDDVALVRRAGVNHIALHGLAGCLARPPLERWLDALVQTPPADHDPTRTARASAVMATAGLATGLLERWISLGRQVSG